MDDDQEKFQILEGVRRAKAAMKAGKKTIRAVIGNSTPDEPVFEVALDRLLSTKPIIETSGSGFARWRKAVRAAERGYFDDGSPILPIDVKRGGFGIPVSEVMVEGEDDLEQLF